MEAAEASRGHREPAGNAGGSIIIDSNRGINYNEIIPGIRIRLHNGSEDVLYRHAPPGAPPQAVPANRIIA